MGVITSIRRNVKNAGRCSVYVDDVFFAACPIDVALSLGLRKGLAMSEDLERRLRSEDRRMVLRQKAYRFATYKPRSERDIARFLSKHEATDEEAVDVMLWLKDFRLIDDADYARRFIDASKQRKPLSPSMLRRALLGKGLSEAIVDSAMAAETSPDDALHAARHVARKKLRMLPSDDARTTEDKLVRFLQYRGYSWEVIKSVIAEWKGGALGIAASFLLMLSVMSAQVDTSCSKSRMGDAINQFQPTTLPVKGAEGELYLDRKNHPENAGGTQDPDDVWVARRQGAGWSTARPAGLVAYDSLQRRLLRAKVMFGMSYDGLTALVAGPFGSRADVMSLGIFMRDRRDGPFTRAAVVIPDLGKNFFASMSEDKQAIIVALERPEGMGDLDLYVISANLCTMEFGQPVPLGPVINTPGFEGSPWIACDNTTLYFASSGREDRRGKADLYMTRRLDATWTSWSAPVNLGSCINSSGDETTFSLPCGESRAFITSWDPDSDRSGIYTTDLPMHLRPQPTNELTVRFHDLDGNPVNVPNVMLGIGPADASPRATECPERTQFISTDAVSGTARTVVARDSAYWIFPARSSVESWFIAPSGCSSTAAPLGVDLLAVPTKKPVLSVFFEKGRSDLSETALALIAELSVKITKGSVPVIRVVGFADASGSASLNEELSLARAEAVARRCLDLVAAADGRRIDVTTTGMGVERTTDASVPSDSPTSRRVDIYIGPR